MAEQETAFLDYARTWLKANIDEFAGEQKALSAKEMIHLAQMFYEKHLPKILVVVAEVSEEYEQRIVKAG